MTDSALQRSMQTALAHHQAGRLAQAEAIYHQILAEFPSHTDALNLLGVLAGQAGHADRAVELISRAIAINPDRAQYHGNLAEAYRRLGQLELLLERARPQSS